MSFLSGKDITDATPAHCAQVGALLANLHVAGQSYVLTMDNPRGPKWWKAVMPEIIPFMPAEDVALLREEVRFQSLYRFSDLPRGVIHADLFRDNVLFENTHVSGVIDFYFACTDALLYDVAITVNDWCMDAGSVLNEERCAALLDAYRQARPFTAMERGAWPVMLRGGGPALLGVPPLRSSLAAAGRPDPRQGSGPLPRDAAAAYRPRARFAATRDIIGKRQTLPSAHQLRERPLWK